MRLELIHLFRSLRRSPATAAAAVVTLSLTLGAGTAIFAVVDAVLLTPPPFADPDALVTLGEVPLDDRTSGPRSVTYARYEAWRDRAGQLAALEAFDRTNLTLTELGATERLSATDATPGFLSLLGVAPALGRGFTPDDFGQPVAIVSDAFWRSKLAADPSAIDRSIVLGGRPHTVVGVMPRPIVFALDRSDLWRPLQVSAAQARGSGLGVVVVARLAPNVTPSALEAALGEISQQSVRPARAVARSVQAVLARDAGRTLAILAGAAGVAMAIAFTNLAGLLLVRAIDRRRELAVRTALGAKRYQIARPLLLEAQALVALGTAVGVLLAIWLTPLVAQLALEQFGGAAEREIAVNWRAIAAAGLLASACALICSVLPAFSASRRSAVEGLRRGTTSAPREVALRRLFVTGEVALAFVLIVSLSLLGRSLYSALNAHPGFDATGVLAMPVSVPSAIYGTNERVIGFYTALQRSLEQRLGDRAAAIVDEIPLTHDRGRTLVSLGAENAGPEAVVRTVGPAYFDVMRIPVAAGRAFDERDDSTAAARVVLSESLARRLFGPSSAVGRQVRLVAGNVPAEVIGVVGDVRLRSLDENTMPTVYVAAQQAPSRTVVVVIRSALPDADAIAAVREEVARLDRNVPVYGVRPMASVVASSPGIPARRVLSAAFLGFGVLAVALGAIGLFGVAAHDVASRRSELALRVALGADPVRLMSATLARGGVMVLGGLAAGGVLSIWAARTLGTVIASIDNVDALSVIVASVVLLVVGAAAVLPAARRAAKTDPLLALRSE